MNKTKIEIDRPDRMAIIEAIGTVEDIAAFTAIVRDDARIWTAAEGGIPGGYGRCIVFMPPGGLEG